MQSVSYSKRNTYVWLGTHSDKQLRKGSLSNKKVLARTQKYQLITGIFLFAAYITKLAIIAI